MRKTSRVLLLKKFVPMAWMFSTCTLFASTAYAQALWQKTTYGMTAEEVAAAVPGIEFITSSRPSMLYSGARELMRLPEISVAGYRLVGRFYFKDEKLEQVMLELPATRDWRTVVRAYADLHQALATKYGKPVPPGAGEESNEATWIQGKTNITLAAIGFPPAAVNIAYYVRLPVDSDKL